MTKKDYTLPIAIIASLFFIFGFVTWINGSLIPFMKTINELTESQSYLVATASYISFVVFALPASYILTKIGYKRGMSLGLLTMGIGALIFIPAANSRTYWLFLLGIFTQGAGMTLLQTASNPYITILGPIESAARRISIMGIANKVAGALGSIIFGALLLNGIEDVRKQLNSPGITDSVKNELLNNMANSVVLPYIIMAAILFILAIGILKAPLPDINNESEDENDEKVSFWGIFKHPHLLLGALTLFFYVGAEVIAGDTIIAYGLALNIDEGIAQSFTALTLLAMVVTYAFGVVLIPKYLSQSMALKISASLGILFSIAILFTTGMTSIFFVASLGIANALVWPAVWPLALDGLGKYTKIGSALLIMGIFGGAIIPPLYGNLVDKAISNNRELALASTEAYWILIPCYVFILFYAFYGHRIKK